MIQLLKMDITKLHWKSYLIGFVIINIAIASMVWLIVQEINPADIQVFYPSYPDYHFVYQFILTIVRISTTIAAAIFLVNLIINEYKSKTISVLFLYPIPRWKLLLSKMFLVGILTTFFFLATTLVSFSLIYMANLYSVVITEQITSFLSLRLFLEVFIQAIVTAIIGFIPLFFGMIRKSVIATMVAAAVLAFIVYLPIYAPNNVEIYGSRPPISIILVVVGVAIACHFIYRTNRRDIV
ncbi:ABC-2 family transporter protein [Gracilibacillus orientalis]|uniref:ABC-2 family transporter protein n=1 Tax=Gracilibacillus orientalis TaxID=334253 RepID=A0A1I4NAL7_9BACI|nr:ABC transporter permease [Gracilibacillus orientalis]SFM12273.1 ABC-2 family transporter protein [Gracilibacillus orientalis]